MPTNINALSKALKNVRTKDIPAYARLIQTKVALQALEGVVFRSPVDVGRFRGNWQVSLSVPSASELDGSDKSGRDTKSRGEQIIFSAPAFSRIFLVNNLPYAIKLEEGSSDQAPNGMVVVTVNRLRTQFR